MTYARTSIAPGVGACTHAGVADAPDITTMGGRILALRKETGMSRMDVVRALGALGFRVTEQSIYRWEERGAAIKDPRLLMALAELFRADPRWIVRGDPDSDRVRAAFAEFMDKIGSKLDPPLRWWEHATLVWQSQHDPSPDRYWSDLRAERKGETEEDAARERALAEDAMTRPAASKVKRKRGT
jgi:transcriptional regulator with XRE-family HTH domain